MSPKLRNLELQARMARIVPMTRPTRHRRRAAQQFVPVANNDELSSNLVGLDVYNNSNQDIGQIKDIAMGPQGRTRAYILSVGGFLGMGDHYIAVRNQSDVKVELQQLRQKWHAAMNTNAESVKAAPSSSTTVAGTPSKW